MLKSLFKNTLVAAVVMATSVNAFAADKVYRLKLAESWGPNFPVFGDSVKNMVKMAEEMSNGRLKIRVDSANKHKSAFGVFDMVKSGQYDMGHSASYYYKGKVPNTMYFTTMPFGMTAMEQYAWFQYGGGQDLMDELYAQHNLVAFPGGNTGVQMGGWFRKEINSLEDLKNLKMRIPGFAGEVLAKLGATPVNIPPGELYTALERNTIDALEWVGPSLDLRMGFHKIAPFYYMGWHEPATELMFIINKKKMEKLPADLQAILKVAMHKASYDMYVQSYASSAENWAEMTSEYPNIQVKTFPPEVLTALKKANDDILAEKAADDEMAARIIKSQQDYLKLVRVWTDISEFGYIQSTKE
ncbi:ABC transporter substrate-binding protein [Psychromonas sp. B3M02]|uniref:TRAP transporter substrate-binding protein n=1 Tax=Psychromonas sp. B3M02 TaxID=2267226 RepID=UPI000DE96A80|nr:TRAP transporter substrate-binding protein [Psychromonas sp. B3M02]RBW47792.1 ABC transporter substrate-binding protein [Psychromonas sp. B3M02]